MTDTNYPSSTTTVRDSREPRNRGNKNLFIGILAAALLGTWGYLLWDKNKSSEKIQVTQTQSEGYMSQRDSLKMLYDEAEIRLDSITGANNNLQGKLTDREKDIEARKSEIRKILNDKNASQAQLARARTLISELNDRISNLEADVTRLTGENQELTVTNTGLQQDKADLEQNLQTTSTEKEELERTVDVASTFSASNIAIQPINEKNNGKEKSTTTAKRVDKLVVSFDVENRIAKSGPADMYLIVTAPDGKVISDGASTLTTRTDGDKAYTAKIPIEYAQGTRKAIQFPIRQNDFQTGNYKIEVYHNGFKIGEGVRSLKKGGLFG
jgi:hypothetical protein